MPFRATRTDLLRKKRRGGGMPGGYIARQQRRTDVGLGAAGRTGAGRQAYLAQQRLGRPGGRQAAAQKIWAPPAGYGGTYNYPVPPPAQTAVPAAGPSTPFSAERLKATVQGGRGVPGSQYEGAGALGGRTVRDWQSPEGRYVGPGAPAGAVAQDRLGFLQAKLAQAEDVEALGRPSQAGALRGRAEMLRSRLGGEAETLQAAGQAGRRMLGAEAGMAEAQVGRVEAETGFAQALPGMLQTQMAQQTQMQKVETITQATQMLKDLGLTEYAEALSKRAAEAATGGEFVDPYADQWVMQVLRWLWNKNPAMRWIFGKMPEEQLVMPPGQ